MHQPVSADASASAGAIASLLAGLTPEQQQAVVHGHGPLLIFAGPGAGKTRTITHRIAHLLASGRATPTQIVAVTFTVRAAGEMRERLAALLGVQAIGGLTVATFHSVCARLIRAHAGCFARGEDYTIYDQADMRKVVEQVLGDTERATIQHQLQHCGKTAALTVLREISLAKNRLWNPDHYAQQSGHPLAPLIAAVWRETDAELKASNAFDFDDLLVHGVRLLAEYPTLQAHYRTRWPWLLVDEFQDTNYAQMAAVSLLAGPQGNLTVVADDDQLVYGFRGAEVTNVLGFGDWFPRFATVTLGRNYRCRAEILTTAAGCVEHNNSRVPKALVAMRGPGGRIDTPVFGDDRVEAAWVCRLVSNYLAAGVPAQEIIVIARTAYVTMAVQQSLAAHGVPYRVLGSLGLFERSEVKDAIAYLSLLANGSDALAFRRAVQAPRRGVGAATANRLVAWARDHGGDLIAACQRVGEIDGVRQATTKAAVEQFGEQMDRIRRELWAGRSIGHTVTQAVMQDGGVVRRYQHIRDTSDNPEARRDAERVLEDLRSLCRAAATYEQQAVGDATLTGFLEQACGLDGEELGGPDQRITISTIHRAKGSEARLVVLIGCEERLLPSWRSIEDQAGPDDGGGSLDEERRLFYVACTRAKDHLVLTRAHQRSGRDTDGPSRFLVEAGL
jgi:DNA helicase-2/ATP-dependent DNA helicase PcrA